MIENDMTLSLKSNTFSALKEDFDSILSRTIGNMEMKCAENATVTVKLSITLEKSTVVTDERVQDITKPSFKHDISSVMQVKDKKSGALAGNFELVWDKEEGKYVMRKIDDGQTTLYEKVEDFINVDATGDYVEDAPLSIPDKTTAHVPTRFQWLTSFVGQELTVENNDDIFELVDENGDVLLTSDDDGEEYQKCDDVVLEGHVGHSLIVNGWKEEDGDSYKRITVDCKDCDMMIIDSVRDDVSEDAGQDDDPATISPGADDEHDYDYEDPSEE